VCNIYITYTHVEPQRPVGSHRAHSVFVGDRVVELGCPPYGILMVVGGDPGECAVVFAEFLRGVEWAPVCLASALDILPGEEAWVRELLERVLALMAV